MDVDLRNFCRILKEQSLDADAGHHECERLLNVLNYKLTEEQLPSLVIDYYMIYVFDKKYGLLDFVLDASSNRNFESSLCKSLEIVYTLINNFSNKVAQHIVNANEKCLKIIQTNVSAKVKIKALDILLVSLEKVDKLPDHQESYLRIFESIKNALKLNHPDTVKQKEYLFVGLFAKQFSYLITNPDSIKSYFLRQLDNEIVRKASPGNISALFTALTYFCESFPLDPNSGDEIEKLYGHIRKLAAPPKEGSVKVGNRAALCFLKSNINVFIKCMLKEYTQWLKNLLRWLTMGYEDVKTGEDTLKSYLIATSKHVKDMDECKAILLIFMKWIRSVLKKEVVSAVEKRLAIFGLKCFCSPFYEYLPAQEARDVFLLVMRNFEGTYVLNNDPSREEWEFLPDFIQCVASYVRFQKFSSGDLYCLQRAIVNLFKTFPQLKPSHHSFAVEALVTTLFYLMKTKHFDAFLENIIYQGVIWSCSHQHIVNSDVSNEISNVITVKNYFPLWRGILKLTSNRKLDRYSIFLDDRNYLLTRVVDQLTKTLMILVNKLNVKLTLCDEVGATDLGSIYKAEHGSDYAIFLNVIDFYCQVFNEVDPSMFKLCIVKMIKHFMQKCLKYPLVSGFYKLLSATLKIANNLNLLVGPNPDANECQERLTKFTVVTIQKMKRFKDELLIACLRVLLEMPASIVEPLLLDCVPAFVVIFEIGKSYIALADAALDALERWQNDLNHQVFDKFVIHIVHHLDSYIMSKSLGSLMQTVTNEPTRKTSRALKKRQVLVELEPELVKFQRRALAFIGNQTSRVCQALVSTDRGIEKQPRGDALYLKVALPYDDVTLDVYLESLVTRIVDLALHCSDRRTKIIACEVLQAIVVVLLGQTKQMTGSGLSDVEEVFKTIISPLLQLSCDADLLVRQIFEPLFLQLMHWYSSPSQATNPHVGVILDILMEGVTHPTNSSLRDISGQGLKEFIKWTIKQSSKNALIGDPKYIKVIIRKMRFFASHPDLCKKVGAAVIFNNIYRDLREEQSLINAFTIEVLHIFVSSLSSLRNLDEEVTNVADQINKTLVHVKRILLEKAELFRKVDAKRRTPSDIEVGNLKGVAKWLLIQTGSISKYCRNASMELFVSLAPLSCSEKIALSDFVQSNSICLKSLYENHLLTQPACSLNWVQGFSCLLDGYIFIINNNLMKINLNRNENEPFIAPITIFLTHVIKGTINEEFKDLKASCCVAILKLAHALIIHVPIEDGGVFWRQELWIFLREMIFDPYKLGFDYDTFKSDYIDLLGVLFHFLVRKLSDTKLSELRDVLGTYTVSNLNLNVDLTVNVSYKQRSILKGIVFLKPFHLVKVDLMMVDTLMNNFYLNLEENVIFIRHLSETASELCRLVLEVSLSEAEGLRSFLTHLFKPYVVQSPEVDSEREICFGIYLLKKFENVAIQYILERFEIVFEFNTDPNLLFKVVSYILNYLMKNECVVPVNLNNVLQVLLSKWTLFTDYFEMGYIEDGLEYIKCVSRVFKRNRNIQDCVLDWLTGLILKEDDSCPDLINLSLNVVFVLVELVTEDDSLLLRDVLTKISEIIKREVAGKPEAVIIINKLLAALPLMKSTVIFQFIIELYSPVMEIDTDLSRLLKTFMINNKENHKAILNVALNISLDPQRSFEEKKRLSDKVLTIVLKNASQNAFELFIGDNIDKIIFDLEQTEDLGRALVYFGLVEVLFLRIPMCGSSDTESSVNRKIRQRLVKLTLEAFKTSKTGTAEELRKFKCGAYKALASIVSNSIKLLSFYEKLFIREENNSDVLWKALVDTNVHYNFSMVFDSLPAQRKELVNIREELRFRNARTRSKPPGYIESQKIFNSSLSEDVTKFDFTGTILRSGATTVNDDDKNEFGDDFESEISLDSTEIDKHECMATVCVLIRHIFHTRICTLPENEEEMAEIPNWMQGIRSLLLDKTTHNNIKIFWVKVIDNTMPIFRHFARYFIEPLLRFITDKVAGGDAINYFVSDVIRIISSWSRSLTPNETEADLASQVLKFVTENLTNERNDIFKYNLELIKLMVENWKGFLKVPYEVLRKKLNVPVTDRRIEVGIHLASVFLANGVCPWEDEVAFWTKLSSILSSDVSSIYKPCSETIGLLLKYLESRGMEGDHYCNQLLRNECNINKYAYCLEGIAIHYPSVVDNFHLNKMFNRLSQSDQNLLLVFLKIIYKRADVLSDVSDFQMENWSKHLQNENAQIQLVTIEILIKTFKILRSDSNFVNILNVLSKYLSNPNVLCRSRMYDLLMLVLDGADSKVADICQKVLVRGLADPDEEIRAKIRTFWAESALIPFGISEKFQWFLSQFYYADSEAHFLNNVSYFLLISLQDKQLFEHPLEDCDYEPYQLTTNWRLQHPSVVPLFAETLQSYTEQPDDTSLNAGELRATQTDLTFSLTQKTTSREREISQRTGLESSLVAMQRDDFINPNDFKLSQDYKLPKRRFLKDKAKISANFAHIEVGKKIKRAAKRYDSVKEAEKKIQIYRKYRKGDFPDILITLDSLIKPLQMLVLHDTRLSKDLFSALFKSLTSHIRNKDQNYLVIISESIKRIFVGSVQFNHYLFSALFDILLENKKQIRLDADLISHVCQQSGHLSMGSLLLEEYVMNVDDQPSTSKKSGRFNDDLETNCWVKLAELYREKHEWNLAQTIFAEKTDCGEELKAAVRLESENKWRAAQEKYEILIQKGTRDFYYESLFKCLAHLGSWDKLPKAVESTIPDKADTIWETLWDGDWYQHKVLPWFIEAQLKDALFVETAPEQLFIDINKSLTLPDQAEFLEANFAKELGVLWLIQGDVAHASRYCENALGHFLNEWQLLDPSCSNVRYDKLITLRSVVEILRFTTIYSDCEGDGVDKILKFLDYCKNTQRECLSSIISSEETLLYRRLFIRMFHNKMTKLKNSEALREVKKTRILLNIDFMNAAVAEGNYYMTRKYFKEYAENTHHTLSMILVNLTYLYAMETRAPNLKLDKLLEALERLDQLPNKDEAQRLRSGLNFFDISQKVTDVLKEHPELYPEYKNRLLNVFGSDTASPEEVAAAKLKEPALTAESDYDLVEKALVKLAYFVKDDDRNWRDFSTFVLKAMRLGSKEARQLFPCVLLKNGLDEFVAETEQIPTWMFLGWIPQLLAAADSTAVTKIILRIANTYPQAIIYDYRLSKRRNVTPELDELLLNDSLVDKFLKGLSKVNVPLVSLGDYIKKMYHTSDMGTVLNVKRSLEEDMFKEASNSRDADSMQGNMYKIIGKEFKNDFDKITKTMSEENRKKILIEMDNKRKKLLATRFSTALKDYCPWLANFSAGKSGFDLEIPGQYTGEELPLVQHHVKISGFRPNVTVMHSLRKPVKITMVGMDGKEYSFLVKFGEDVRQDQRIQQLFKKMNNIFANDNKLHEVLTYQVIPLTTRLGIIQWVDNCQPLETFIRKTLDRQKNNKLHSLSEKYFRFLISAASDVDAYGLTAAKKDQNQVVPFYNSLVYEIPMDVLKSSFLNMSLTTESFLAYRDNFVKSYAALCICQWLLGIGDRHLENSMVCTDNGKVIGIDFGHAFGTATQFLSIPELVPIRLTPHILALMEPLKEKGTLRHVMIDCLKSLRQNSASLLATMDVFVQEPSVDWMEIATKTNMVDFKKEKVKQARKKLLGSSSVDILIEDLKANPSNRYKEVYIKRVRENSRVGPERLSVEEQVDCLIEHATDPNLLGRMFMGWKSWL